MHFAAQASRRYATCHPLSLPRVRVCHTHLRASPQRTAAQESHSPQLSLTKNAVQLSLRFGSALLSPDDIKKVNMVTSPCRQDPFQKFLCNRDGTFVFDNCQQIWFEFLRTRVDEVRRTRTENPYVSHLAMEDRRSVQPLTHTSCVPMAHCRLHSHVKNMFIARVAHARDWSAFTSVARADMLEGFNRMNRRKCTNA